MIVYLAHPVGNDVDNNVARATRWLHWLMAREPEHTITAPWMPYCAVFRLLAVRRQRQDARRSMCHLRRDGRASRADRRRRLGRLESGRARRTLRPAVPRRRCASARLPHRRGPQDRRVPEVQAVKSLDDLKSESAEALRVAREHRERREAKRPVLDAFDRLSGGEALPYEPGPRHQPRLAAVRDCKDCGEPIAPRDVAQGFTTCAGCAETRRDIR